MRERFIFGPASINNVHVTEGPTQVWKQKPGRRKGESPQLFSGIVHCGTRNDLPFFQSLYMRVPKSESVSGKNSTGYPASASRNEDPIHKLIREYFDYSPGFASIPASVIARYLGSMLTEYVGSTENRDEITMCDTAYHATRTISFIIALQEAFGKEVGNG